MPGAVGRSAHDLMEERARKSVDDLIERLRRETAEKANRIKLPKYARDAVKAIDRRYFRGRKLGLLGPDRFPPEMQRFLPIVLLDDACDNQRLRDKLHDYARYMTGNYAWVWCTAPVTIPMRLQARDLLLREGESEFGETPMAAAIAFVRYHYQMLKLSTLTDFGVLYNRAYTLDQSAYFRNLDLETASYFEQFKDHREEAEVEELRITVPDGPKTGEESPEAAQQTEK
jgi:hypothetical protein